MGTARGAAGIVIEPDDFPRLSATNHRVTSPPSPDYNCVAWAANDALHWWQPGEYWPKNLSHYHGSVGEVVDAFEAIGFVLTESGEHELEFTRIAIYAVDGMFTHVARQLTSGKWTSKLGGEDDIEHDNPECLSGGVYGEVAAYL